MKARDDADVGILSKKTHSWINSAGQTVSVDGNEQTTFFRLMEERGRLLVERGEEKGWVRAAQ